MELLHQLWGWIIEKSITTLIVVPLLGYICWVISLNLIRLGQQAWCFIRSRGRALSAVKREASKDGAYEGKGVWLTTPINPPHDYWRCVTNSKTLAIANLKGGVGKTTLAANIGAYLAKDWEKSVARRFGFQGSLSSMAFPDKDWLPQVAKPLAARLISGDIPASDIRFLAQKVDLNGDGNGPGRLQVITAYYDLAQADNRVMIEWLLECGYRPSAHLFQSLVDRFKGKLLKRPDVRYTLAEVLHSDPVQKAFDLIIIDCPPRLTTSEIQAFCASSHLLIPTIFDRTSAEAVGSLFDQVDILRKSEVCPHIEFIGVVGTMWRADRVAQRKAMTLVGDALAKGSLRILPEEMFVPHAAALVNDAEEGIAYISMPNRQDRQQIRAAIGSLAEHVAGQMGIRRPAQFREAAE